jgi:hypothetical protein
VCLATALRDAPGELLPKAAQLWPELQGRFAGIAMHVTSDTCDEWRSFLRARQVPFVESPPAWDHIGLHRRRSLALGLERSSVGRFLYADPDHILRWVERQPAELDRVVEVLHRWDGLIIGRSEAAFRAAPARLRRTESVINHIYRLMTGNDWDLMMAARGFSRRAAEIVVATSTCDTLGNDVEWPLLMERAGLNLGYVAADGLTYETNPVYASGIADALDDDPAAWMLRVYAARQHVEAMRRFLPGSDDFQRD